MAEVAAADLSSASCRQITCRLVRRLPSSVARATAPPTSMLSVRSRKPPNRGSSVSFWSGDPASRPAPKTTNRCGGSARNSDPRPRRASRLVPVCARGTTSSARPRPEPTACPLAKMRNRPGFSVISRRPSGNAAMAQGNSSEASCSTEIGPAALDTVSAGDRLGLREGKRGKRRDERGHANRGVALWNLLRGVTGARNMPSASNKIYSQWQFRTSRNRLPGCRSSRASTSTTTHKGETIYVGKARSLRDRTRSYLGAYGMSPRHDALLDEAVRLEVIVTDSVVEALALENNLIKQRVAALQHPAARRQELSLPAADHDRGVSARAGGAIGGAGRQRLCRARSCPRSSRAGPCR